MDEARPRRLGESLRRAAAQFPVVVLTGPRQAGKTTLVRQQFGATHRFVTLDDPQWRGLAQTDATLLLGRVPPPLILDEVQYAPDLLPAIKVDVDRHRDEPGRYILTGSQSFPLMDGVSESLAGRAAVLTLQSMSLREQLGLSEEAPSVAAALAGAGPRPADLGAVATRIWVGGFPDPAVHAVDPSLWHSSYLATYLERDVRNLRAVGDLGAFQRFVAALAARTGGLLNTAELARDLGISAKSVSAWVSVLETSGQVVTLRPWFENLGKRLVKHAKVYFTDSGILAHLLGLQGAEAVLAGIAAGPLFEAAVFGALLRAFLHRGQRPRIHSWRTADGHEVDFLVEDGSHILPVEAKLTATPSPRLAQSVERLQRALGPRAGRGYVVCLCERVTPLTDTVDAVPLGAFG